MAAGRIRGITIEIDGDTSKLTTALSKVDHAITNTQKNLRDLDKALKLDPGNTALLKDKQRELGVEIDATKERIKAEQEALDQMKNTEGFDATSEKARNLQTQIDLDTVALKELEEEAKSCGSVIGQQMEAAGQKISSVGDKIRGVGDKISGLGRTLTTSITVPVVAAGTAAVKMASDYEENLNKVDVAFKNSADQVKEWAKTATTQFGLSENAALEATSLFGDMGTAMGLTEEEAANMSTSLAGLAGDLSSFKNVDIEQAMNALKGVFTGETESLKNLGIVMTQTNLEEFADKTGRVYKEMSQAEKVALRYEYVIANTQNAQGDYARTSDGMANSIRTMQASLQNLGVTFGQEILPYITPLIQKVTELIQQFASLDDETKKMIITVAAIAAAIGPALLIIGNVIGAIGTIVSVIGGLVSVIGTVLTTVAGVVAGLNPVVLIIAAIIAAVVALGYAVATHWEEVKEAFSKFVEYIQPVVNAVIEFGQVLIEFIQTFVQFIGDKIKSFLDKHQTLINAWMITIKAVFSTGFEVIKEVVTRVLENIKIVFTTVFEVIKNLLKAATAIMKGDWSGAMDALKNAASAAWNGVKAIFNNLKDGLKNIMESLISNFKTWGKDMIDNLISGIKDKIDKVKQTASDIAGAIAEFIHFSEPDKGPLKDTSKFMPDMIQLLTSTMENSIPALEAASEKMAAAMAPSGNTLQNGGRQTNIQAPVNITVYGAEGQDVRELADIIQTQINNNVYRNEAVFA